MTTPQHDHLILQAASDTPLRTALTIRERLQLQVSVDTWRKRLHQAGIHHRIPAMKERRLEFADQHVHKDHDFWSRVVFSDEKSFCSTNNGRPHVWTPSSSR